MMLSKRRLDRKMDRVLKTMLGALPAIPFFMRSRRRRAPVAALVLGGIGIAIAGGIAALMLLSPRARSRTLNAAKTAYDKVNEKVIHGKGGAIDAANGLVERLEESTHGT